MSISRLRWILVLATFLVSVAVGAGYSVLTGTPLGDISFGLTLWKDFVFGRHLPDLIEDAYFTDRELTGGELDPGTVPRIAVFPTDTRTVTFLVFLRRVGPGEKGLITIRTRWYDESGVERHVVRTGHSQRGLKGGTGTWASHHAAGSAIARHPGRWTVKLTLDGMAAGAFHFRVVTPGPPGQGRPPRPPMPEPGDRAD